MTTDALQPWVEKYRPKKVSDLAHQDQVVNTLNRALQERSMPHLLFYGPPGTGKTSAALAIGKQLFGPELYRDRVMELNASDERGINVVREKIKTFAARAVGPPAPGYPCPPFKLLILDEADSMTQDAQSALRRTMEQYSKVTRFCFCCNYVSRIIDPLASRCAKFRFQPLEGEVMRKKIAEICESEGVTLPPDAHAALSDVSGGDLRKAITTLQSAVRLDGKEVRRATVLDVSAVVPTEVVSGLVGACRRGGVDQLHAKVLDTIAEGYAAQQLLLQVQAAVLEAPGLSDVQRGGVLALLAGADKALVDGADETLQLLHVCTAAQQIMLSQP
ncbi:unnamed protein product [Pedinophyceae sp. YPF-701]|nr:unnamed protein product [Pedinophyceae sp. YPF-701]